MKCLNCGKEIANDSVFCEYCGTKIHKEISRKAIWGIMAVMILFLVIGIICINGTRENVSKEETIGEIIEEVTKPRTHVLQPGEFLAGISMEYYGTEDSVAAIIRLNKFTNPDNVPVGTELLLP